MEISVTEIIKVHLVKKGISKVKLAELIGHSRQNLNNKLAKNDIDVSLLYQISLALEHDFFSEISSQLPVKIRKTNSNEIKEIELAICNVIESKYPKIKNL